MSRLPHDVESEAARRERTFRELLPFSHDRSDPVERWRHIALRRVLSDAGAAEPRVELGVGLGFLVLGLLAGLPFGRGAPLFTLLGLTSCVLGGELPRALLGRRWGCSSSIVLGSGGAATESFGPTLALRQAVLSELSGPFTNAMLGALLFGLARRLPEPAAHYLQTLALWQAGWGFAQLLPLVPFRAGRALGAKWRLSLRAVLTGFSLKLLLLGGLVLGKLCPVAFPLVVLAAAGATRDFLAIYQASSDQKHALTAEAASAERLVGVGEGRRALGVARRALARVRSPSLRARLWRAFAWAAIGEGDPLLAHAALGALPPSELDVHLVASYLATCNRTDEAVAMLEQARSLGQRSTETTRLLLDLLLRRGEIERGRVVAHEDSALLTDEDVRLLARSAFGSAGHA